MPWHSDVERLPAAAATVTRRGRGWGEALEIWNEKLHYYTGLYLLLFIWLFSFTGLVLNHQWEIHNWWAKRVDSTSTQTIQPPKGNAPLAQAEDLAAQLHMRGEIRLIPDSAPGQLAFRVYKPGLLADARVDLSAHQATVHQIHVNRWGFLEMLHTFDVEKRGGTEGPRGWLLSKIWCLAMDAVAVGLIFMVLSSYYMWLRLKKKHLLGWLCLASGFALCGFFVAGLNWLYRLR
jgi:hypothetical protein